MKFEILNWTEQELKAFRKQTYSFWNVTFLTFPNGTGSDLMKMKLSAKRGNEGEVRGRLSGSLRKQSYLNGWWISGRWRQSSSKNMDGKSSHWLVRQMITSEKLLLATNWDGDDFSAAWENGMDLESTTGHLGTYPWQQLEMWPTGLRSVIKVIRQLRNRQLSSSVVLRSVFIWREIYCNRSKLTRWEVISSHICAEGRIIMCV